MPRFKTETIFAYKDGFKKAEKFVININAEGLFYCNIPEYLESAAEGVFGKCGYGGALRKPHDVMQAFSVSFDELHRKLKVMMQAYIDPEITEEHVIRYNIESHVSFAVDDAGNIFPNAGYPGAHWPHEHEKFGEHHASRPVHGGYSLTIGAAAYTKRTVKFGEKEDIRYSKYYAGGHHLGKENPAEKLNSWCSISLPDKAKEIPYSDEAALFFHRLLYGMAEISKRIQDRTFEQEDLLTLIKSNSQLLLTSGGDK